MQVSRFVGYERGVRLEEVKFRDPCSKTLVIVLKSMLMILIIMDLGLMLIIEVEVRVFLKTLVYVFVIHQTWFNIVLIVWMRSIL